MKNDIHIRNKRLAQQKAASQRAYTENDRKCHKLVRGLKAIRCKTNVHKIWPTCTKMNKYKNKFVLH